MISTAQEMILLTKSPEETFRIGEILAEGLEEGNVIALMGELGSGKTCLTQGIAKGLGVPEDYAVTSPTFTLINEYPGRKQILYHMDAYRLAGCSDLSDMGYEEYVFGKGIMVIEWAEKIRQAIPDDALFVNLSYIEEKTRKMVISCPPAKVCFWQNILEKGGY